MSHPFPPPTGGSPAQPGPGPYAGQGSHTGPPAYAVSSPYAGAPAYGAPSPTGPAPRSTSAATWGAAGGGILGGILLASLAWVVLWVLTGGPLPWQGPEDVAEQWSGRVAVSRDGGVSGQVLAEAVLEGGGGGFYEDVACADTAHAEEDVLTLCQVDDGVDAYRVGVLFLDDTGRFEMAEFLTPLAGRRTG